MTATTAPKRCELHNKNIHAKATIKIIAAMTASADIMRMTATTASGMPPTAALMTAAGGTLQDGTMPLSGTPTGSPAKREGRGRNAGKKAKTGPTFWTRNATAAGST